MITASIATYKTNKAELKKVIESASNSPIQTIYIIDNSPTEELKEYVLSLSDKVKYQHSGGNIGYGGAHNIAIKRSIEQGEKYHVVLNPDITFDDSVIPALERYMDENEDAGSIMPLVKYPDGEIQYLCKLQATPLDLFGRRFIPFKSWINKRNEKYELHHSDYNKILNAPCLSGCFMFLRNSALEDIGLFDDSFFMYLEDYDLYKRMHKKYKTIFYPHVYIVHDHKKESFKSKKMMFVHIKSAIHYFNKWGWFFDKDRREANKAVLEEMEKLK